MCLKTSLASLRMERTALMPSMGGLATGADAGCAEAAAGVAANGHGWRCAGHLRLYSMWDDVFDDGLKSGV